MEPDLHTERFTRVAANSCFSLKGLSGLKAPDRLWLTGKKNIQKRELLFPFVKIIYCTLLMCQQLNFI